MLLYLDVMYMRSDWDVTLNILYNHVQLLLEFRYWIVHINFLTSPSTVHPGGNSRIRME